jgi:hypothetical protein
MLPRLAGETGFSKGRSRHAAAPGRITAVPLVRTLALAAALLLAAAPAARADGDPASDFLVLQDMFYGYGLDLKSKPAAQLPVLLQQSRAKGYEIRVALISRPGDLGSATPFWGKPKGYATFLGQELSNVYKQRTLVVMPDGYGIFHAGHSTLREQKVLDQLPPPRDMLPASLEAVQRLAAASGVNLAIPDVPAGDVVQPAFQHATATATATPAPQSGGSNAWLFLVPVAGFVAIALLARRRARTA